MLSESGEWLQYNVNEDDWSQNEGLTSIPNPYSLAFPLTIFEFERVEHFGKLKIVGAVKTKGTLDIRISTK